MNDARSVLQVLGFHCVGRWLYDGVQLKYELVAEQDAEKVLYAFVTNDTVLYVGKTIQPLRKRMYGYQNPNPTQRTNIRCHGLLVDLICSGLSVDIHVLPDDASLQYRGHSISLAAGLEDSLIAKVNPPWNKLGT